MKSGSIPSVQHVILMSDSAPANGELAYETVVGDADAVAAAQALLLPRRGTTPLFLECK